jgi:hypothetical protein
VTDEEGWKSGGHFEERALYNNGNFGRAKVDQYVVPSSVIFLQRCFVTCPTADSA